MPDKQYHIFQKSKSFEISITDVYIGKDLEFVIQVFYWCNQLDMKSRLNVKKVFNLIIVMPSYNICSGIKSQQAIKKNNSSFSIKNFWFFSEFLCSVSSSYFQPFNFMCVF